MEAKPVKVIRVIEYWYENEYWASFDRTHWTEESQGGTKIRHKTIKVSDKMPADQDVTVAFQYLAKATKNGSEA